MFKVAAGQQLAELHDAALADHAFIATHGLVDRTVAFSAERSAVVAKEKDEGVFLLAVIMSVKMDFLAGAALYFPSFAHCFMMAMFFSTSGFPLPI